MKIDSFCYFYPEAPRLTSIKSPLFQQMSDDPNFVAEKKYNGNRLQLHVLPVENGMREFQYWDRHGKLLSYRPSKEMEETLDIVPFPKGYCLLDGELRHNKVKMVRHKIVFYDVFIWDGRLLADMPFVARRIILENLFQEELALGKPLVLSIPHQYQDDFGNLFNVAITDPEIEGLVMKNINGMLNLGRNSANDSSWMVKVRKESGRYRF